MRENSSVFGLEILLHIVVSALAGCASVAVLMRSRGVRGVRALQRDLLDLEADHSLTVRRLKKLQNSAAGEASVEAKKELSKTTIDFIEAQRAAGPSQAGVLGQ